MFFGVLNIDPDSVKQITNVSIRASVGHSMLLTKYFRKSLNELIDLNEATKQRSPVSLALTF